MCIRNMTPLCTMYNSVWTIQVFTNYIYTVHNFSLSAGTVVGSALALAGFGLSFVTGGLSLGLTVAGAVLSAAGGVTAAGANIGYLAVSTLDLKHARMAVETDQEMMEKAKKLNDELAKIVDSLAKKYPTVTRETIYAMLHDCVKFGKAYAEVLWSGYKMVDGAFDVGRTIATATGKSAASAARTTVWAGLSTTKRVVSVVGAVFDVVFIPVDLYVMIKTSIEIHKFKTTGESNSDVAKTIGKLIKQLEEHRDELIKKMC